MEQFERNPLLEPENFFEGYNKSIESYKNNPEIIAFDRMCYELFEATELGRKFIEFVTERFFVYSQVQRGNPTYQLDCIWQEGFRDAYRMLMNSVMSHKQRIRAETNNA